MLTTVGTPTDEPFFVNQWHLNATGQNVEYDVGSVTFGQQLATTDINILNAWEYGLTGQGIQVVIADGGFDLFHEDLLFTTGVDPIVDLLAGDADPSFVDVTDGSGTAIAGIIGARDNGVGTIGVAYQSDLIPLRLNRGPLEADTIVPTIDAINAAFRYGAGLIVDTTGDGVPDSITGGPLVPVDIDGDGTIDGLGEDPNNVTDVFIHSSNFLTQPQEAAGENPREAVVLPEGPSVVIPSAPEISIADAIVETANAGRAVWNDLNGNNTVDAGEITALGSIHVVAAGNDAGRVTSTEPFEEEGDLASSQYDELANSIYTITVGGVAYDGRFENDATGTVSGIFETGSNVLLVAPAGLFVDVGQGQDAAAGVFATDASGDNGFNLAGLPNFEFDGDFFGDTNYTSALTGSEAAAAQVAGVVALMLEANPLLTYREVQQILLQSAVQTDQFSESWVVNQFQTFRDYVFPEYAYYDLDTDGEPGADIENAIIPNVQSPQVIRGFFLNDADADLGVPWNYDPDAVAPPFVDTTGVPLNDPDPDADPPEEPVFLTIVGANIAQVENPDPDTGEPYIGPDGNPQADPTVFTPAPIVIYAPEFINTDNPTLSPAFLISPINAGEQIPLEFENGAGFTVSQGFGNDLEEYGYAHGLLDAELAVELALAYALDDFSAGDSVTITSNNILGEETIDVQARAFVTDDDGDRVLEIPGGVEDEPINTGVFDQFFAPLEVTEITSGNAEITVPVFNDDGTPRIDPITGMQEMQTIILEGDPLGEVITGGPFYDPDNSLDLDPHLGIREIPFFFDASVVEDFVTVEWIEFTTELSAGDVDALRLSIVSPDGTQSELNAVRPEINNPSPIPQRPQGQQGIQTSAEEVISGALGPIDINTIIGTEVINTTSVETPDDFLDGGEAWTWTTNRHFGEIFSTRANDDGFDFDDLFLLNSLNEDGWSIVVENHGDAVVELGGNIEVVVHGTRATGNRIQGKIGIDDNAQSIGDTDNDENFNFNRFVEFADVEISILDELGEPLPPIITAVVLDDTNDSVTYSNTNTPSPGEPNLDRIYKTVDPATGEELLLPVIDRDAYFSIGDATVLDDLVPILDAITPDLQNYVEQTMGAGVTIESYVFTTASSSSLTEGPTVTDPDGNILFIEDALSYRNFDYSQESFASGVVVVATQFEVEYDSAGGIVGRTPTGVVEKFITGADGNYYFDVEANPEPPEPGTTKYDDWFNEFGSLFEYEISLESVGVSLDEDGNAQLNPIDNSRVLTNEDGGGVGYFDSPTTGLVDFDAASLTYNVAINASEDLVLGATTKIENLNFLLTVDPAETNVDASGTVFRDRNGDGAIDGFEERLEGVTVFYDANGNGVADGGDEVSAVTAADGTYTLTISGLTSQQNATIVVDQSTVDPTLTAFNPASGELTFSVTPGTPVSGANFSYQLAAGEPAQVNGLVFDDVNGNGVLDGGEVGIDSTRAVTVFLDTNGNGVFDGGEPSDVTAPDGTFNIESSPVGLVDVRIDPASTVLTQTEPDPGQGISVNVLAGQTSSGLLFGLFDDRTQDFGDLFVEPGFNYPTLLADNGARHVVVAGLFLGAGVDVEADGIETMDATGDDASGVDDEDGVVLLNSVQPGGTLNLEITATGQAGSLNAWVDFNQDGDWDDPGEQIFVDEGLTSGATNLRSVPITADVSTTGQFYAARFRWGPIGLSYDGAANAGEVEDYFFSAVDPVIISGFVRQDADGGREFEATDTPLADVVVFSDTNLDGVRQQTEPSATTNALGQYTLPITLTSTTELTIVVDQSTLPEGIDPIAPTDGIFSQSVDPAETVSADFLVGASQGLMGNVSLTSGGAVAGATLRLLDDPTTDGVFDTVVATTTSDAQGNYTFATESIGDFQVELDLSAFEFLVQSTPASGNLTVAVTVGMVTDTGTSFTVFDQATTFTQDFGDLIVSPGFDFPTTLADDGARHTVVSGVRLGADIDADPGTAESANATADDLSIRDDEDGVVLVSGGIAPNSTITIDVTAFDDPGVGAVLNGWIDFNDDGDWNDPGERIFTDRVLLLGQTNTISVDTPADVAPAGALVAARFRWGVGVTDFTGSALSGEVEDYLFPTSIVTQQFAAGDYDEDGDVDVDDFGVFSNDFLNSPQGGPPFALSDFDEDGDVDVDDFGVFTNSFLQSLAQLTQPLAAGDYNRDGSVDGDDHTTFAENVGADITPGAGADGNGDGVVNAADFTVWRDAETAQASSSLSLLTTPSDESAPAPAVESATFVAAAAVPSAPQAVADGPLVDSALAVETAPATDSGALDAALLQLADSEAAPVDSGDAFDGSLVTSDDDEYESLELVLDDEFVTF